MTRPTVTFEQWSVVVVPFPFTDRDARRRRPAIVLSSQREFGAPSGQSVLAMVTSAVHAPWPLDVVISDLASAGLPAPSVVRMKLFTRDNRLIQRQVGTLGAADREAVSRALDRLLG
jgi:mRNA interferase MazF